MGCKFNVLRYYQSRGYNNHSSPKVNVIFHVAKVEKCKNKFKIDIRLSVLVYSNNRRILKARYLQRKNTHSYA